jgi:23S rRNA (cytidine2498-2'-O)-methyltransferase
MNVALAPYTLELELERELRYRNIAFEQRDRLFFFDADYRPLFAQVIWINCQRLTITSINDGVKQLRALGKNWSLFSIEHHRRAQLIQEGLPKIPDAPMPFLAASPKHAMGGWTLYDSNTIICSPETTSRYPLGKVEFIENKTTPPSRAYLKLWEFFTLYSELPAKGSHVLDMGACPGGWSWVLASLGLRVTAVDKAPLDNTIARMSNITFLQESAFALDPARVGKVDSFFSDIICYPERLLTLVKTWMAQGQVKNFVCTIKFQGEADFAVIDAFLAIPGSQMVHLYHNKHEVTWWVTQPCD